MITRLIVLSPKLKFLLQKSVEDFALLFDSSNCQHLPIFRMFLTFDDEKMEIYPTLQDLEATIFEILTSMTNTLQVKYSTCFICLFATNTKTQVLNKFGIFVLS